MNRPSPEQIDAFVNALQLSILSEFTYEYNIIKNQFRIKLLDFENDKKIERLCKFLPENMVLVKPKKMMFISDLNDQKMEQVTNFLLLTRLEPNLIEFFAKKKDTAFTFLKNFKAVSESEKTVEVKELADAANYIFAKLAEKNMTLRELSELTGMTQANLHRFKNHQDIKLSTLIKMAKALDVVIKLE